MDMFAIMWELRTKPFSGRSQVCFSVGLEPLGSRQERAKGQPPKKVNRDDSQDFWNVIVTKTQIEMLLNAFYSYFQPVMRIAPMPHTVSVSEISTPQP